MFSGNGKISVRQFQILSILVLFSGGSLTLPRITSEIAQQNGWILVFGACGFTMIYAIVVTKLGKLFPTETFVQYSGKLITKPMGVILSVLLLINLIGFVGFQLRIFGELIKQTLLPSTPVEIIIMSMLAVTAFLGRKGIEARGRIGEIVIFLSLIPIGIVLLLATMEMKVSNLAPFFTTSPKELVSGSFTVSLLFTGIELWLINVPAMRQPQKATRAAIESIVFVSLLFIVINVVTVGIFGDLETSRQIWPVMTIMEITNVPGAFIERQDALMVSFWILMVFMLITAFISNSSKILQQIIGSERDYHLCLLIIPFIYIGALIPDNVPQTFEFLDWWIQYFSFAFCFPIPLILLIIAKIRGLGVKDEN